MRLSLAVGRLRLLQGIRRSYDVPAMFRLPPNAFDDLPMFYDHNERRRKVHVIIPLLMYVLCLSLPWIWLSICYQYNEMHLLNLLTSESDDTQAFVQPMTARPDASGDDLNVLTEEQVQVSAHLRLNQNTSVLFCCFKLCFTAHAVRRPHFIFVRWMCCCMCCMCGLKLQHQTGSAVEYHRNSLFSRVITHRPPHVFSDIRCQTDIPGAHEAFMGAHW